MNIYYHLIPLMPLLVILAVFAIGDLIRGNRKVH